MNQCPPEEFKDRTTYPTFPVDNPPEGKCGAKYKNGWIWESAAQATDLLIGIAASGQTMAQKSIGAAKRSNSTIPDQKDPDYCKINCETADETIRAAFCPSAFVENSVSLALLRLTARIVKTPPTETKIITMKEVLDEFNVEGDVKACPRSDVVISKGLLVNQGADWCVSDIQVSQSAVKVRADLRTPPELRANLLAYPDVAVFSPTDGNAFTLTWEGKNTQRNFGGPIISATEVRRTDVSVGVLGQEGVRCAALEPEVARRTNVHEIARAANKDPSLIRQFSAELERLNKEMGKTTAAPGSGIQAMARERVILLPLVDHLDSLERLNNKLKERIQSRRLKPKGSSASLNLRDVALLVDMRRCQDFIRRHAGTDFSGLIPKVSTDRRPNPETVAERNRIAGDLLLCTRAADLMSSGVTTEIDRYFPRLP